MVVTGRRSTDDLGAPRRNVIRPSIGGHLVGEEEADGEELALCDTRRSAQACGIGRRTTDGLDRGRRQSMEAGRQQGTRR